MRVAAIGLSFLVLHTLAAPTLPENPSLDQRPFRHSDGEDIETVNNDVSNLTPDDDLVEIINASPLLSLHRSLSAIKSVSNDEHNVGVWLTSYLQKAGFRVETYDVPYDWEESNNHRDTAKAPSASPLSRSRFNIYAYPSNLQTPPEIILTSHIDTVPPFIPYSVNPPKAASGASHFKSNFTRGDIIIAGRGTVDAKASVAAQITAAKSELAANPKLPLGLLFVVSEETGGRGMKSFSNNPTLNPIPPNYHTVIFGEPTELSLVSGHKGLLLFKVTATGLAAHSGYPWLGRSAVSDLLPVLMAIDHLGNLHLDRGGLPASPLLGRSTCNIGVVNAGIATNVVPAHAEAGVSVRLAAGTMDGAKNIISHAVRKAAPKGANITVSFTENVGYEPVHVDTDVEGFNVMPVNYGTDVPNLDIHGEDAKTRVKRYLYGPGNIFRAHGDEEALTVRDLEGAVEGYVKLIKAAAVKGGKASKREEL